MNALKNLEFLFVGLAASVVILGLSILGANFLACWFGGTLASWVQAVGTILAIVSGFSIAAIQTRTQNNLALEELKAYVQAAHLLSFEALTRVSGRLESALTPSDGSKILTLQGDRTTEMILAMREFDIKQLPAKTITQFIHVRSQVFAINENITKIFESEEKNGDKSRERSERRKRLESSIRVRLNAIETFKEFEVAAKDFLEEKTKDIDTKSHTKEYEAEILKSIP